MLHGRIMGAPLHTVALVGQYPALINLNGKTSSPKDIAAKRWNSRYGLPSSVAVDGLTAPVTRQML